MKQVLLGTRGSDLALAQSHWVAGRLRQLHPDVEVEIQIIQTTGDKITDVPLGKIGGKGLFTKELETALLGRGIDLAVHSLKDLPTELPAGLAIGAIPARENPADALVSIHGKSLEHLPAGGSVGTSSLRRKVQLLANRPDLRIIDLRGNVPTRLRRLEELELDAIVLAAAGLNRLALGARITEILDAEVMLPAVGQGALGIEMRADDAATAALLAALDDAKTRAEVTAERALLQALGGGCQVPLGALARLNGGTLRLDAAIFSGDGRRIVRGWVEGHAADAIEMGRGAAEALKAKGGLALMHAAQNAAGVPDSSR